MKRLLSILIALLLFATSQAQIGRYPFARAQVQQPAELQLLVGYDWEGNSQVPTVAANLGVFHVDEAINALHTGVIKEIRVWRRTGVSGNVKLSIYNASGNKLWAVDTDMALTVDGWNSFTTTDIPVTQGTNYKLGVMVGDNSVGSAFLAPFLHKWKSETYSTFTSPSTLSGMSDYADFIVGIQAWGTVDESSTLFDDQVAYYAFDETSGSTATDSEGSSDGTIKTNVTINQTGKYDKAYTYPGDYSTGLTQGIWCGTPSALNLTTEGTISAWIKFYGGAWAGMGTIAGTFDWDSKTYGYNIMLTENGSGLPRVTVNLGTSSTYQSFVNTTAFDLETWVHVVGAWDADSIYIWINGANLQKVLRTRIPDNTDAEFCIGRSRSEWNPVPWGWGRTNGDAIDELRVFNKKLTTDQVEELYNYEP